MPPPIQITEVLGRADAGISSNPFRCRGKDGRLYYVKLGNTHPRGLIAEWICAQLAREIGLPIADFSLVSVSSESSKKFPSKYSELGSGVGFGSAAPFSLHHELWHSTVEATSDDALWAELLAFDAWIQNEDRKLGPLGGNPNTLYLPAAPLPILLIDHDSAFDPDFDSQNFVGDHLAGFKAEEWLDEKKRARWTAGALKARESLDGVWETIPEQWLVNSYGEPIPSISKYEVESILDRPFKEPDLFWSDLLPE